jgi:hypothetical protein
MTSVRISITIVAPGAGGALASVVASAGLDHRVIL